MITMNCFRYALSWHLPGSLNSGENARETINEKGSYGVWLEWQGWTLLNHCRKANRTLLLPGPLGRIRSCGSLPELMDVDKLHALVIACCVFLCNFALEENGRILQVSARKWGLWLSPGELVCQQMSGWQVKWSLPPSVLSVPKYTLGVMVG
jgi:hypothetical protein